VTNLQNLILTALQFDVHLKEIEGVHVLDPVLSPIRRLPDKPNDLPVDFSTFFHLFKTSDLKRPLTQYCRNDFWRSVHFVQCRIKRERNEFQKQKCLFLCRETFVPVRYSKMFCFSVQTWPGPWWITHYDCWEGKFARAHLSSGIEWHP